ncbi:MAG TPA: hypothetical protein HA263_08090 [Methanoregulaceae archaeon]|nr:hypothetical protein [Methanoregulaceae archaeon]
MSEGRFDAPRKGEKLAVLWGAAREVLPDGTVREWIPTPAERAAWEGA